MTAYYNEFDPYAAQWLRNLIAAGHIADGVVDERSIVEVRPDELAEFVQCHFFAGIGVWSHALRAAGWPDDRRIWTGSCPCQPFSAAGKGNGFDDERHLWPAFFHLIQQCRPDLVLGEQVASKDGLAWLDLVHADLEGESYAVGALDTCAAGFGAPHIRQRLYWVADANGQRPREYSEAIFTGQSQLSGRGVPSRLGNDDDARLEGQRGGHQAAGGRVGAVRSVAAAGESGRVADASNGPKHRSESRSTVGIDAQSLGTLQTQHGSTGPVNGFWRTADWLYCRDGKWRPVEPGTFPLAHGATARVGRLRGYGNAINAAQAQGFIEAVMQCLPE